MKKLSKIVVKDQAETLNKEEMKLILGGGATYRCYCGMGSDAIGPIYVTAINLNEALFGLSHICRYGMGGCFM